MRFIDADCSFRACIRFRTLNEEGKVMAGKAGITEKTNLQLFSAASREKGILTRKLTDNFGYFSL
ncbi:hypothetical protein DQG23_20105 [Paenibacillus contaminans]|uniref:Uncharacterized protein n=1 Tax=Paenibacillus contaminans TaxID=450362 RepID=A0A329MHF4_9BACL|nr:hypothetical protein DQG23_20105 [Paenibacillus contaminans]